MTPATERGPGECEACAADPRAAPHRWCAPLRCYCGHPECPAYVTGWRETPARLEARERAEDAPQNELEAKVLQMGRRAGAAVPERLQHTEHLRQEWDAREEPTWLDRL